MALIESLYTLLYCFSLFSAGFYPCVFCTNEQNSPLASQEACLSFHQTLGRYIMHKTIIITLTI